MLLYYSVEDNFQKFSRFLKTNVPATDSFEKCFIQRFGSHQRRIELIAYCIMPTHVHLVIKQLQSNGIKKYMANLLNSYARYFNISRERKGPLWVGRFKSVLVQNDEQLLHLTRYVHLNPVKAGLTQSAKEWAYSSMNEYLSPANPTTTITDPSYVLNTMDGSYEEFVNNPAQDKSALGLLDNLTYEDD